MKVGMLEAPFVAPRRTPRQVFAWAVWQAIAAEQAGFAEFWVAEHSTLRWESIPSPELVIAAAARETERIRLGPLAHLLPYHNPVTLAVRTAWMSHVLEGRYMLGVATGAYPSDAAMHGISDMAQNSKMMVEALEIMSLVWQGAPFAFNGQYWHAGFPGPDPSQPWQQPWRDSRPWGGNIPIAMTGLTAPSKSIEFAASRNFIPASIWTGDDTLRSHFATYRDTSLKKGRSVDRTNHRVVRDVFVADTDAEAKRRAIKGMGPGWINYLKPNFINFELLQSMLPDPSVDLASVDAEFLAEHVWICGSPETVQRKIEEWCDRLGGSFGTIMIFGHDFIDDPKPWEESMQRLAIEVAPKIVV